MDVEIPRWNIEWIAFTGVYGGSPVMLFIKYQNMLS